MTRDHDHGDALRWKVFAWVFVGWLLPMLIVAAPFFWTWAFVTRRGRVWRRGWLADQHAQRDFPAARLVGHLDAGPLFGGEP